MDHHEYMRKTMPARDCSAHDMSYQGRCFNCGYNPDLEGFEPEEINQRRIDAAVQRFPETFGLYSYPAQLFRINRQACYVNGRGVVILSTQIMYDLQWTGFADGTMAELEAAIKVKP